MSALAPLFGTVTSAFEPRNITVPPLPSIIRYWDDFEERTRTLERYATLSRVTVYDDGRATTLDLEDCSAPQRSVILHVIASLFDQGDVTSVTEWMSAFGSMYRRSPPVIIDYLAAMRPFELRAAWDAHIFPDLTTKRASCLRKLLHVLCELRVGTWAPEFRSIVTSLPAPKADPFAVVRSGECFVPPQHLQILYEFLDEVSQQIAAGNTPDNRVVRDAAALVLADQHGLRPGTIARIKPTDVRIYANGAVHITVVMIKKHDGSERIRVNRRIKREWCPIFNRYSSVVTSRGPSKAAGGQYFLALTPIGVTKAVGDRMKDLTGERWTPTDLRHTAAQRMVDSGASADQLAEFMGQNSTLVGNVYFDQSPTQAHRVNQALAISPIYSVLPEIHRTKIIDKEALLGVPEDNQIGGTPHGIPISGIGACTIGQSICRKNPVVSCYGCSKFLAVNDPEVHDSVVESLRSVVLEFYAASLGNERSPAYNQLQRTLTKAQAISNNIRSGAAE